MHPTTTVFLSVFLSALNFISVESGVMATDNKFGPVSATSPLAATNTDSPPETSDEDDDCCDTVEPALSN